jgi:hypothetical protein
MTYGLVILSYRRRGNLEPVVESVRRQDLRPSSILVWHNSPSTGAVDGAINVFADRNFGPSARHAAAMLLAERRILFLDDDVTLAHPAACRLLVEALGEYILVGAAGRNLSADPQRPYSLGREMAGSAGPADVVKGWFSGVRREALHAALKLASAVHCKGTFSGEITYGEDDILLSAACRMATGQCGHTIAFPPHFRRHLLDGLGNENRPDHYARRDAACRELLRLGWKPKSWE